MMARTVTRKNETAPAAGGMDLSGFSAIVHISTVG